MSDDRGVSNERTALAWQRTALALMAGAAIMARLTFGKLGWVGIAVLSLAMLLSAWVFLESAGRYSHSADIRPRSRPRGGRAGAWLAGSTVILAAIELAALAWAGS